MSHNVEITGVRITDLASLNLACAELRGEGINVTLERAAPGQKLTFRTYKGFGSTNNDQADAVIRLSDCAYDIGLVRQSTGHYTPVFDNALGLSVACPIACEFKPGVKPNLNFRAISDADELAAAANGLGIGRLMQRYATIVTEAEARRRGYVSRRVTGTDGAVQVVLTVRG